MTDFTDVYVNLLIKQYYEKPNAVAEIAAQAATWETIRDVLADFENQFDLDQATGDQLDLIGKLVGLPRNRIEFAVDDDYRFYIRVKIAKNIGSAFLASDNRTSIQQVIQFAFENAAYVVDNKDMSLTLYLFPGYDSTRLQLVIDLNLLPKPQGVQYYFIEAEPGEYFGFADNSGALGFDSSLDGSYTGGLFAKKVFI